MRHPLRQALVGMTAVVALVTVLGGAGPAQAREGIDPESYRPYDVGSGEVTLDIQDALFGQVVAERIQPRTRVNIDVAPEAAAQLVTIRVVDLHWVLTLESMTEKIGGVLVRRAPNLLRIERPEPVEMEFTDEDIRNVVMSIARYSSASVILSPEVEGTVTLTLNNVPWRQALEQVVRTLNYALVEEDFGILRVVPVAELDLEAGLYHFRYMRPPVPYKGVISTQAMGSTQGQGAGAAGGGGTSGGGTSEIVQSNVYVPSDNPAEIEDNFPVIEALREVVSKEGGEVRYIASQNAVIYRGTRPRILQLRNMLAELDVEPPQIFIDMNFIVTSNEDALTLGLQSGPKGLGVGFVGSDILHMLPFNVGGGSGGLADVLTGTPFPSPAGGSFNFGRLTFSETELLLRFLQNDTSTRIVQAPKILALDNQEATIFIGETVRYARTSAATNQSGGLTFAVEEDPNSPVSVGFQLLVIPNVIRGENKIMMTVIPQRRALTGTTSPVIGFDRYELGGQTIDLPRVQSSTLKTAMILSDGETAVIGGLLEDQNREGVTKVPLLGDLPLIGLFFQGRSTTTVKQHLLITITPRILRGSDAANCTISDELAGRSERVATEWQDLYGHSVMDYPGRPCPPPAGSDGPPPPAPEGPPPPMVVAPTR